MFDSPLARRRLQLAIQQDPLTLARLAGLQGGMVGIAGMPQGAMTLADLAQLEQPEPPQMVTPAAPAPMQPGREIVAPVGPGVQRQIAEPTTEEAILGAARMRAAQMQDAAAGAAVVPEEIEQTLASREARYGKEMERLQEDQKRAGWEALAEAGFRMAQSQSPYFMSALAEGMQAGLTGFNAKKAAAAERKARLQEQQENIALERFRTRRAEEERAQAIQAREIGLAGTLMGQEGAAQELALKRQTAPYAVELAQLRPEETRAEIAEKRARTGLIGAQTGAVQMGAVSGGGGGGGGTPARGATVTANRQSELRENYIKATQAANEARIEWIEAGKPKNGPEAERWKGTEQVRKAAAEAWRDATPGGIERGQARAAAKAAPAPAKPAPRGAAGKPPPGVTQAEWNAMTPEERALFR